MAATTWVDTVILEGEVVYERSKDPRLQYLFEAAEKAAEPQEPKKASSEAGWLSTRFPSVFDHVGLKMGLGGVGTTWSSG